MANVEDSSYIYPSADQLNITLPEIIGMPPRPNNPYINEFYPELSKYNFNMIKVQPRFSILDAGMVAIKSTPASDKFYEYLDYYGVVPFDYSPFLKFAILNEGAISDGISNSYGPSFLGSAVSMGQGSMSSIQEGLGLLKRVSNNSQLGQLRNNLSNKAQSAINSAKELLTNMIGVGGAGQLVNQATNALSKLAQGFRIDLGNIWTGSSASTGYSCTIRLYNPIPNDYEMYKQHVVGPLTAILTLATPLSQDGIFYDRPFICRIDAPGMYLIKEAAITSINVTKGGDNNDYTFEQLPNCIDVRLSFESIYPSMINIVKDKQLDYLNEPSTPDLGQDLQQVGPPTVEQYVDNLLKDKSIKHLVESPLTKKPNQNVSTNSKSNNRRDTSDLKKIIDLL